jgi:integron integrase
MIAAASNQSAPSSTHKPAILPMFDDAMARAEVSPAHRPHWQRWVEQFMAFRNSHESNTADASEAFLTDLKRREKPEWQIAQAESAIQLYESLAHGTESPDQTLGVGVQPAGMSWDEALDAMTAAIAMKHYSRSTYKNYTGWVRRFRAFVKGKAPMLLQSTDAKSFLEHLALVRGVSASSQNLAFNALLFLYATVLKLPFENLADTLRARRPRLLPRVISMDECLRVFDALADPYRLMAELMYGCGLRLSEGVGLRVQDIDFEQVMLTVRAGKGQKDRTLALPQTTLPRIKQQLARAQSVYRTDMKNESFEGAFLPDAVENKTPKAAREFAWYWLFPARELTSIEPAGTLRRYHIHPTALQKEFQKAVQNAGIARHVTPHTLRHTFATHLLQAGYDIRQVQDLLGHADVRTTMIYLHVMKTDMKPIESPLDIIRRGKPPGPGNGPGGRRSTIPSVIRHAHDDHQ